MKRAVILGSGVMLIVSISIFIMNFNLFDEERPTQITEINTGDSNYKIAISYSPSNSTIQEQIIVQKSYINGAKELLANFERYQILVNSKIVKDTIVIVLADTSSYVPRKDTVKIKLN